MNGKQHIPKGSQILVREMERKFLRLPGEGKQIGDEIDDKIYRVSVTGYVQPVPCFRVGRRWSPSRSAPSPLESLLVPGHFEIDMEVMQISGKMTHESHINSVYCLLIAGFRVR